MKCHYNHEKEKENVITAAQVTTVNQLTLEYCQLVQKLHDAGRNAPGLV